MNRLNFLNKNVDQENITRVEVIDKNGRKYVNTNVKECILSYQDNNKTLKIFLK